MASDFKTSSEDADMAECSGEKVVTMMDVLQDQEEFEEDANAVLGASDEKSCTYSKGYIKRQALYACLTCCSEAKLDPTKRAGVCLACSLMCHENHDLVELYTKRNFRCDCGNPNFNSHPCTFTPNKTDFNEDNIYNQNFSGLYCTCQRPYPDPESTEEVEMIQCIICEDWLHTSHLESTVPSNDQYSEMICKGCMIKNNFLHDYCEFAVNAESADVDIVNGNGIDDNKARLPINDDIETNTTSNVNETKSDLEITEKHLERNVTKEVPPGETNEEENEKDATTIINENSEKNDSLKDSVEEKQEVNMSELKKTEESEEKSISTQEEASSNFTPKPSNNSEEDGNIIEGDNTKDNSANTAPDMQENCNSSKTHLENIDDQKEIENLIEEQNKQADEKQNEDTEQKNTDEKKEQDSEKMEEDRLLADPEDDKEKSVPLEEKDNIIEEHSASKITENITTNTNMVPEIEVCRPENEQNSEDQPKVSDEKTEKPDADAITKDAQNEITIQPESKQDGPIHSEISSEKCKVESNSPDKILEKRKHEEENSDNQPKKQKLEDKCIRPKGVKRFITGATFWTSNFRQKLCTCQECISMYKDLSVLFLTDPEDTVSAYENLGKEKTNGKPTSQYERGVDALLSLGRIQQINALTEYNRMRDRLLDYLKSFKDKKEIVKEEDIRAFFAGMKPKRQSDGVYFCR